MTGEGNQSPPSGYDGNPLAEGNGKQPAEAVFQAELNRLNSAVIDAAIQHGTGSPQFDAARHAVEGFLMRVRIRQKAEPDFRAIIPVFEHDGKLVRLGVSPDGSLFQIKKEWVSAKTGKANDTSVSCPLEAIRKAINAL
jgi:hypothetical protein